MNPRKLSLPLLIAFAGALAAAALLPAGVAAAPKKITIAVVRDGPTEMNDIVSEIRPELNHLAGADYEVAFDMSDEYDAGWDPRRIRPVIERAMSNKSVDIVLGIGWLVTKEAARPDHLSQLRHLPHHRGFTHRGQAESAGGWRHGDRFLHHLPELLRQDGEGRRGQAGGHEGHGRRARRVQEGGYLLTLTNSEPSF